VLFSRPTKGSGRRGVAGDQPPLLARNDSRATRRFSAR
jgi:hypothetical protein